jgi:hypothetical protein
VKADTLIGWRRKGFRLFWRGGPSRLEGFGCPKTFGD